MSLVRDLRTGGPERDRSRGPEAGPSVGLSNVYSHPQPNGVREREFNRPPPLSYPRWIPEEKIRVDPNLRLSHFFCVGHREALSVCLVFPRSEVRSETSES